MPYLIIHLGACRGNNASLTMDHAHYFQARCSPVARARRREELLSQILVFDWRHAGPGRGAHRARGSEIIATHGVTLGGDDFDSAIMRHSCSSTLARHNSGPKELPFPPNPGALALQTIPVR